MILMMAALVFPPRAAMMEGSGTLEEQLEATKVKQ